MVSRVVSMWDDADACVDGHGHGHGHGLNDLGWCQGDIVLAIRVELSLESNGEWR